MVIPFHLVIVYSLGTYFLPADHYLGLGFSGNYFDSRISSEWQDSDVVLHWRYGPVLSYTNSIYVNESVFLSSSLSYSAYMSESRRNDWGEGYIWLEDRDNLIKSDFQFIDAGFGVGVNMKMNKITLLTEIRYSYHDLYFGTFYSFRVRGGGSETPSYNDGYNYRYRGAGRSMGINMRIVFKKKLDQNFFPYLKYNFIDTTHIDEYYGDNLYEHEYFLDERWEVGILYDFKDFKITL